MILSMKYTEFLTKLKFPELRNSGTLVLLNKDKISELLNWQILFSLKQRVTIN